MSFHFNDHSRDVPSGAHAILSPSKYTWTNYDSPENLTNLVYAAYAQEIGTLLHRLAEAAIKYRVRIPKVASRPIILLWLLANGIPRGIIDVDKYVSNFVAYVNDAIGFDMSPEVVLKYSDNAFGTADAIRFNEKKMHLRNHDYKSGVTKPSLRQLEIYAALFCLEYNIKPRDLQIELRIYWQDEIVTGLPTPADIVPLIDLIREDDKFINNLKGE